MDCLNMKQGVLHPAMMIAAIFCTLVTVIAGQGYYAASPVRLPSSTTCAATPCLQGTTCREVFNKVIGVVQAQCGASNQNVGITNVCSEGQPLLVTSNGQAPVQASCGWSTNRIECPSGYVCNVAPNDAYAVCCPTSGRNVGPVTKAGSCPTSRAGLGLCISNCQSDGDCPGVNKCCSNSCGRTCQTPIGISTIPPAPAQTSCSNVSCLQGTTCREVLNKLTAVVQAQCGASNQNVGITNVCSEGQPLLVTSNGQTPVQASCGLSTNRIECPSGYVCNVAPNDAYAVCCPTSGRNVRPVTKAGSCPTSRAGFGVCISNCQSDGDCPGANKCCSNSCGRTCQTPIGISTIPPAPAQPSCSNVKCGLGERCEMRAVQCFVAPCYPQPACVATQVTKEGECPRSTLRRAITGNYCRTECQTDQNCSGNKKCCKSPFCGATCQEPETANSCSRTTCRPGEICVSTSVQCFRSPCPAASTFSRCVPQRQESQKCPAYLTWINPGCFKVDRCSNDEPNSCGAGTICCPTDCGRQCIRPQV